MTSKIINYRLPCPKCRSSDAYHIYDDGHGYCFSCTYYSSPKVEMPLEINTYTKEYLPWRGITKQTMQFYNAYQFIDIHGKPDWITFDYSSHCQISRSIDSKKFWTSGDSEKAELFGMNKFPMGSAKAITIYEGALDAMSGYQMLGGYPSVSVRSASTAKKDCINARDYLNSFEKIYLCFDQDEAGKKAAQEVASLFDFNKVYNIKLSTFKDANDFLQNKKEIQFQRIWYNAKRFQPDNIISTLAEFNSIILENKTEPWLSYPFKCLQTTTKGIRRGEITLWTALEGQGKTEIIRAIEYHILKNYPNENIACIHLEESKDRQLKGLAGYELRRPCHIPDEPVPNDEIFSALSNVIKCDNRLHIYSHFGSDDPDIILDNIRFMVTSCGCSVVFLDHITMCVSGLGDEKERITLDYLSTKLATLVQEHNFSLQLISHINDNGLTRGSRNISKVAHTWIALERDHMNDDPIIRNTTNLTIRKNRPISITGNSGKLYFDPSTFIISELDSRLINLPPVNAKL